jgi:hypothetical protein
MAVKIIDSPAVLMPEVVLYHTLNSILEIVRNDFNSHQVEDTILYHYFAKNECGQDVKWETFHYFEQAKELFVHKNKIQVNLGYNMEVSDIACIHILLPSESGQPLGIGADENYIGYQENKHQDTYQAIFTEMFDATYNLIITSESTLEVLLIYNLLKASLISLYTHIELSGLRLPKISGQDIQLAGDLVPPHIFHRSLSLNFKYEVHVPDILRNRMIKDFQVTGIIQSNNAETT